MAVAMALRHPLVMENLGEALRSDIVVPNPFYRRVVEFADQFLLERRKLPGDGDWNVWLDSLDAGMVRDGTKEALGRIWGASTDGHDPGFFSEAVIGDLQKVAAQVARARLNEMPQVEPESLTAMAEKVAQVKSGALTGVARLSDIDMWARPGVQDDFMTTGYPTLDKYIGGWGQELWMVFADSKAGKSMLLQNFGSNAAVHGKNVLHLSLELGLRAQMLRYYRQIAQATRGEFFSDLESVHKRLRHWLRVGKGQILVLERPAYSIDPPQLHRLVERAARLLNAPIHMVIVDYLDLLAPTQRSSRGSAYEDLGRLTHETRGVSSAFECTTLTASQAVRRPRNQGRLTMHDMGDSYNKVRGVDGLLSLVQTEEEEEIYQGRLGLVALRDSGGGGREIPLYINRDLSLIQELDHPNTVELMRRLGHLPGANKKPVGGAGVRG